MHANTQKAPSPSTMLPHSIDQSSVTYLQNILQFGFLRSRQCSRESHIISNDEITPGIRFLAKWHAEIGVAVFASWLCGTGFVDVDLAAVDGGYGSLPACECFF